MQFGHLPKLSVERIARLKHKYGDENNEKVDDRFDSARRIDDIDRLLLPSDSRLFPTGAYCGPALASPLNLLGPQQPLVGQPMPSGAIPVAPIPAAAMQAAPAMVGQPMYAGPIMAAPVNACCPPVCCPTDCYGDMGGNGIYGGGFYGGDCGCNGMMSGGIYPVKSSMEAPAAAKSSDSGTVTSSPDTSSNDNYGGSTFRDDSEYRTPSTNPAPGL